MTTEQDAERVEPLAELAVATVALTLALIRWRRACDRYTAREQRTKEQA